MAEFVFDCAANPRRDAAVVRRGRGAHLLQQVGHGGDEPAAPWSLGFLVFRAGVELVFLVGSYLGGDWSVVLRNEPLEFGDRNHRVG